MKRNGGNRGQAAIELALVLPFLCVLLLGLLDFGILFYDQAMVTNASREGARAGMTYSTNISGSYWSAADMQTAASLAVTKYLQSKLVSFGGAATVTTTATRTGGSPGDPAHPEYNATGGTVEVKVSYVYRYLAFGRFVGWTDTITIGAKTTMRLE